MVTNLFSELSDLTVKYHEPGRNREFSDIFTGYNFMTPKCVGYIIVSSKLIIEISTTNENTHDLFSGTYGFTAREKKDNKWKLCPKFTSLICNNNELTEYINRVKQYEK